MTAPNHLAPRVDLPFARLRARPTAPVVARIAWLGLALVLAFFVGLGYWAVTTAHAAADRASAAIRDSQALDDARYAVGTEESLERKYRLEPGREILAAHTRAADDLVYALGRATVIDRYAVGAETDEEAEIADVLANHISYLGAAHRMFAAIDAGDAALALRIDGDELDPIYSRMESEVDVLSQEHRVVAADALAALARTEDAVSRGAAIGIGFALALMAMFWLALRSAQGQIGRSEVRYRSLVQNASDAVAIVDAKGAITYCSSTAIRVLGREASSLDGKNALDLVHPADADAAAAHLATALQQPGVSITTALRLHHGDGWRHFEVIATNLVATPGVGGVVMTYRDVSERKAFEEQLEHQAFHDSLTGLPNRALYMDRLRRAIARADRHGRTVAVLFLDLDNFKLVNDSLGHERGDALLVEVASRLRSCLREVDTIARLGGDEFTVLVEEVGDADDATEVADRVLAALATPVLIDGREVFTGASIGIALGRARSSNAEGLLRNADLAMYGAKAAAKGRYVVFDPDMEGPALARLELETDLRHALERDEFRLHYQPIVSLEDGHVVALEALIRWRRPGGEIVSPLDFIPQAEATGLIVPIGRWVLETACREMRAIRDEHPDRPPMTMSVNLSARQLDDPDLVADIDAILAETGVSPASLELEITESVAMRDPEATGRRLAELKARGIQLAIDDFGTGYSSLGYLKRLPIDTLKIDRSFVSGLHREAQDTAIIRSVVALGRTLNLCVTAEGIETQEQATVLRALECDRGQGFLYARPMTAEALRGLLRDSGHLSGAPQGDATESPQPSARVA